MEGCFCNLLPLPTKTHLKPPLSHHHHHLHLHLHLLPNPINNRIVSKPRASKPPNHVQSQPPTRKRNRRKQRSFSEEDALLSSIPVHRKNPNAIYKELQNLAKQNRLAEALTVLDYLDKHGIPVNATTFSSLIASCIRLKDLSGGRQIHTHIRINGLEKNEFLRTILVRMYTSCGSVEDAKKVFDEMPSSTVYPWNALLRGNVIMGGRQNREVLSTFGVMRELGVDSNVYTFSCLIKSLAGNSSLYQGLKTHALLIKNGFINSPIVSTSLIDMYFKCGKIKLALRVFEEIGEYRDVVLWGAMIAGFAHNRLQVEALQYVRCMSSEGISPNSVILTTILPAIGEVRVRKLGQEVHAYAIKTKQYYKQLFVQSGLIDMYFKCGDMVSGRKVFYGSMERNAISWTVLMSGYATNGMLEQALKALVWMQQEGFKPDVVTVATVLPVCGKLRALKQGKEIHSYVVKNGFLPNVSISTSLMMMYSKCGALGYSTKLFNNMESRNVISWTAMIDSYIECGSLNEAFGVFRYMLMSKHRPDSVVIARMLSVCGQLRVLKLGKEIHGHVLRRNFESIPFVSSEVVKMYGTCGESDKAMLAFEVIPVKGSMTWTAIIEAYGDDGRYQEAIDLFNKMIDCGFLPNHFTFLVVLAVCEQAKFLDEGYRVFHLMTHKYKVKASKEHYSSIIRLLTSLGQTEQAQRFIQLRSSL